MRYLFQYSLFQICGKYGLRRRIRFNSVLQPYRFSKLPNDFDLPFSMRTRRTNPILSCLLIASLLVGQSVRASHTHPGNWFEGTHSNGWKHETARPHVHVGSHHTHEHAKGNSHSHVHASKTHQHRNSKTENQKLAAVSTPKSNHDSDAIYILNAGETHHRVSRTSASPISKVSLYLGYLISDSGTFSLVRSGLGSRPPPITRYSWPLYILNCSIRC